ncbi:transposase [Spirochaetia bacterium]|nr:transposase [Spirochaetia bacterium]
MNNDFIPPTFDYIVKGVFGSQDDIGNTIGLLTPILGIPPEEYAGMFIADPHLNRRWRKDKKSILDVRLTLPSGKIIQIEVQIRDLKNMAQRVLYDQAKMIADQMESREDYRKIRPVISVLILDHIMFPDEPDYLNTYEFRNTESHRPFTDLQKVITLELPKVPDTDDGRPVWPWAKFFTCQSEEEMEALTAVHPEVRPAVEKYRKMTLTEYMRAIAWQKKKQRMDAKARADFIRDEVIELGRKEGEAIGYNKGETIGYNRAMETLARKMKQRGAPLEQISGDTGLSLEEVGRL